MKTNLFRFLLAVGGLLGTLSAQAQIGVGTTTPAASAALDIASTSKGLLAPRLTQAQRVAISAPAQGLLVYQTDGARPGLWHYSGTAWQPLSTATDLVLPYDGSGPSTATTSIFTVSKTDNVTNTAAIYGAGGVGIGVSGYASTGTGVVGINGATNPGFHLGAGVSGSANTGAGLYGMSLSGSAIQGVKFTGHTGRAGQFSNADPNNNGAPTVEISTTAKSSGLLVTGTAGQTTNNPGLLGQFTLTDTTTRFNNTFSTAVRVDVPQGRGNGLSGVLADTANHRQAITGTTLGSGSGIVGFSTRKGTGMVGISIGSTSDAYPSAPRYVGVAGLANLGTGVYANSLGGTALLAEKNGSETGITAEFDNTNASNPNEVVSISSNGGGLGLHVAHAGTISGGLFEKLAGSGIAALRTESSVSASYGLYAANFSTGTALYADATGGGNAATFRANSTVATPTVRLFESQLDYARLNFENSNAAPAWTIAGLATATGTQANAFLNFYYTNLNGGGGGNALLIRGDGLVTVPGTLSAGTLTAGAKAFRIDHPLDPENQYLTHSCVESPDMLNVYNGNATLDAQGAATVALPAYFEALNRDFRYQLTALGAPGPNLYVAEEVKHNQFRIAGGTPGGRVSWQVTGVRHDAYAQQNRLVPEAAKAPAERGHYLYPAAYGQPASRGIMPETPAAAPAPRALPAQDPVQRPKAPVRPRPGPRPEPGLWPTAAR